MTDLPTVVTIEGLQPQSPLAIRALLTSSVAQTNPGYTSDLPGSLIEDISSTDVAAIALCDSARVELVNSLTPLGANAFLLNQLGQIYGVQPAPASQTSVSVVFSGPASFVIAQGFTVSDGTYQYIVQDGGIIGGGGTSDPLFCLAVPAGSWPVAAGTVTTVISSVPSTVTVTCSNPNAGTPGAAAESEASYRSRVLQAGLAASQGMSRYLKTLLGNVTGVQPRLISAIQQIGGGWEIIVGGGDPYKVAYEISTALFDISTLVGSTLKVTAFTRANPGVVTTNLNHGYANGQVAVIANSNPTGFNGTYTITVIDEKTFSVGVSTSGISSPYVGSATVTPNFRNVAVSINDSPDTYLIPFVNPPQQTVTMTVTWNTTEPNFVSQAAVQQLGGPALAAYVNALQVGVPMNLFELQTVFQASIASILDPQLLTRMVFSVAINGVGTAPSSGTGIIAGDPESYFETDVNSITITQG
jgi:hypothetical protein